METYEDLYKTICRVCLSYGNRENMVCLIDKNSEDGLSCFGRAVVIFANICIKVNDKYPDCMCQNCMKILKHAIYFKLKCESSNKQLSFLFEMHKKSKGNLKEAVLDYLMYKHYFPEESSSKTLVQKSKTQPVVLPEEIDDKSTSDFENLPFENDNQTDINSKTDYDSIDEELDLLEKMVNKSSYIMSSENKRMPLKHRIVRKSRLKHNESKNKSQLKKFHVGRREKQPAPDKFICKICQKELANQHTYNYHMQRHNGCKFICEHCGKGFPVLVELQMHQVARHGTGPYLQCPHCTFKAPRKYVLIEHIRIHTGERPYTCDKCGLTFRRSAIWKKHMVYHMEKTVQCPQCPRKFYRRSEMQAHANSIHERMYVFLCHKCDATYAKTETVRRHLTEKHGIPREMQGKILRVNKGRGTSFPEQ